MRQAKLNCESCGAPVDGLVCGHCGKAAGHLLSPAEENRALDEFHVLLRDRKPEEQRTWLETGFLPDSREVLIEAGVYCLPLLKNMSVYNAAASRLEAVVVKLKLLPADNRTREALDDFRAGLEGYKVQKRKDDILGVGCLLLLLAAMAAVAWWLIYGMSLSVAVPLIILMVVTISWLLLKK